MRDLSFKQISLIWQEKWFIYNVYMTDKIFGIHNKFRKQIVLKLLGRLDELRFLL